MSHWAVQPMDSYELLQRARHLTCYICEGSNRFDAEFCHHCRAPMALARRSENRQEALHLVALLGPPGVGKTVYLGMLTDLLSRQRFGMQVLARGAFSVSLQQQSISALAHRDFPARTPWDPQGWNWVHYEIAGMLRGQSLEVVMPDISGDVMFQELERSEQQAVVREFLAKCSSAMILVDADALSGGEQHPEVSARLAISYLVGKDGHRKKGWPGRPIAITFTKAEQLEDCFNDPGEFARRHTPALWQQCRELRLRHQFFAVSVAGAVAPLDVQGQRVPVPLRIEPRNVEAPFVWLVEQLVRCKPRRR